MSMKMMSSCKMNETKLEVEENYEETELSDVDDDVFIRGGGRNGYLSEYESAKKPLMTPRRKTTYGFDPLKTGFHTEIRTAPSTLRILCLPLCYIVIAMLAMLGLIAAITFITSHITWPFGLLKLWKKATYLSSDIYEPCTEIKIETVWNAQFPKLLTESALRLVDANQDGVEDIILGYATGADGLNVPEFVCDIYFGGQKPCLGGVLALDGLNGSQLWQRWTQHEVFGLNCNEDLTSDGINDCLVSGRAGVFLAVSGQTGDVLWEFGDGPAKESLMNINTAQYIPDINDDGVLDIVAVHGGNPLMESESNPAARILLMSGKTGEILRYVDTPDGKESYYPPQIFTDVDGTDFVLFGTGSRSQGGALYLLSFSDVKAGSVQNAKKLYEDEFKGIIVPPVLTDINEDGIDDIVISLFNSTVIALDGSNFKQMWNQTFPSSETETMPTPGYFNEDKIPDFLVKYRTGPGYPVYYHAQTTILDGSNGKPILDAPIIETIGSQATAPLIRVDGYGNDIFLYWSANCKGHEGHSHPFKITKDTKIHKITKADMCQVRYESKLINQLRGFSQKIGLPGTLLYDSEEAASLEFNNSVSTADEGRKYLRQHPEMWAYFDDGSADVPMVNGPDIELPPASRYNLNAYGNVAYPPVSPMTGMYDFQSQPELTENVKYPTYHNVRKHGSPTTAGISYNIDSKNSYPGQFESEQSRVININRRGGGDPGWISEYGKLYKTKDFEEENGAVRSGRGRYRIVPPQVHDDPTIPQFQNYMRENQYRNLNNPRYPDQRFKRSSQTSEPVQRLVSSGTLTSPGKKNGSRADGIDMVFATYWFYPPKVEALLPKHEQCIEKKLLSSEKFRFDIKSKYYGMSSEQFERAVTKECFEMSEESSVPDGRGDLRGQESAEGSSTMKNYEEGASSPKNSDGMTSGVQSAYEMNNDDVYNPFDIRMGQMTVYRIHITCTCKNVTKGKLCASILPMKDQPWSSYMGSRGDSYFLFSPASYPVLRMKKTKYEHSDNPTST